MWCFHSKQPSLLQRLKIKIHINSEETIKEISYLHSPSGIISSWLCAAENTSKAPNFPMPEGIPSKSNLLSFTNSLLKHWSLHNVEGRLVSLLCDKFNVSIFCQNSIAIKIKVMLLKILKKLYKIYNFKAVHRNKTYLLIIQWFHYHSNLIFLN